MTVWVKTDGAGNAVTYPYEINLLRQENPSTSFPRIITEEIAASYDVYPVREVLVPFDSLEERHVRTGVTPVFDGTEWVATLALVPLTEDQKRDAYARELNKVKKAKGNELGMGPDEWDVISSAYEEVCRWQIDNTIATPIIDALQTVFTGQTKTRIGTKVKTRYEAYITTAAVALAEKIQRVESLP